MTAAVSAGVSELTYREALRRALADQLGSDPDVLLLGEDIGAYGGIYKVTDGLQARFGADRVIDTPISEAGFVGVAVGAAMTGKRPVVELMFMDFSLVAADQLLNQAAKMRYLSGDQWKVPLTVRTQEGVGAGTAAQHSQCLEALFMHLPGFAIALPAYPADAKGPLSAAIQMDSPALVIEHKALYGQSGPVPDGPFEIPFGKANVLSDGTDVMLVSYSRSVHTCLDAAQSLAAGGISAELIDLRTLVPLDMATVLESVSRTRRLVLVHEAHRNCGPAAEIAARVMEHAWHPPRARPPRVRPGHPGALRGAARSGMAAGRRRHPPGSPRAHAHPARRKRRFT
jgi:pyruvate/2-oxoglutarate/acetoin dehydrogenase E1 component